MNRAIQPRTTRRSALRGSHLPDAASGIHPSCPMAPPWPWPPWAPWPPWPSGYLRCTWVTCTETLGRWPSRVESRFSGRRFSFLSGSPFLCFCFCFICLRVLPRLRVLGSTEALWGGQLLQREKGGVQNHNRQVPFWLCVG